MRVGYQLHKSLICVSDPFKLFIQQQQCIWKKECMKLNFQMGSWLNLADQKCLIAAWVSGTFQLQLPAPDSLAIYPSSKNSAVLLSSRKHMLHTAGRPLWLPSSHKNVQSNSLKTLEKTQLLLCRALPSTRVPQALLYKRDPGPCTSPPFLNHLPAQIPPGIWSSVSRLHG